MPAKGQIGELTKVMKLITLAIYLCRINSQKLYPNSLLIYHVFYSPIAPRWYHVSILDLICVN